MIIFIYGTTAEAIKLAPIARRLTERGIPYEQWLTLQHTDALLNMIPTLGMGEPDRIIAGRSGDPLREIGDVVRWLGEISRWMHMNLRPLRKELPPRSVIVVHGDTMTSVVGAWIARRLRVDCAHVEAGLRSGHWRHPFPEELDRRMVGKLATVHYAPSPEAISNLSKRKNVVYTHGNTALDAVLDQKPAAPPQSGNDYGVVLLHRFEFLTNRTLVDETMSALAAHTPVPLYFFVDEFAKETLGEVLPADHEKFRVQDKVSHEDFIDLIRNALFIVTDSGGTQAEAAMLGIPTLIHRKATEQFEGLGRNIVLSEWKIDRLITFLAHFENYRREPRRPEQSPSDIIVDDLTARGYTL